MSRYYSGSYYGPRVEEQPKQKPRLSALAGAVAGFALGGPAGALKGAQMGGAIDNGGTLGDAALSYVSQGRLEKDDAWKAKDRAHTEDRWKAMDPLEEALARTKLYNEGVTVGSDKREGGGGGAIADEVMGQRSGTAPTTGNLFPEFNAPKPVGVNAPGAFNPTLGGFNPPMFGQGRAQMDLQPGDLQGGGRRSMEMRPEDSDGRGQSLVNLGGGATFDPGRSPEGRKRAEQDREIQAMIDAGVPPAHARAEVMGGMGTSLADHLHPDSDAMSGTRYGQEMNLRRASAANSAYNRPGADTRRDLAVVQNQVAGARSDLNTYERTKPKRPPAADAYPPMAQRYTADSTAFEQGRRPLRQRYDSLVGVQDRLAAALQGDEYPAPDAGVGEGVINPVTGERAGAGGRGRPGAAPSAERTDTAGMAARARALAAQPGMTRSQIIARMKAEGWPIADD